MADEEKLAYHEDADKFGEALSYTASETGFSERLIEKDYYCSLVLNRLGPVFELGVAFKGGTSLAKVHAGFYRLSEDLDLGFSMDDGATRSQRRKAWQPVKAHIEGLPRELGCLGLRELRPFNEYRHCMGILTFRSQVSGQEETIKIDVSMREFIVETPEARTAHTILQSPISRRAAVDPISVTVLTRRETYAEKLRAALSRRDPAIRDFYDIHFAVQQSGLVLDDGDLTQLLQRKLSIKNSDPVDVSPARLAALQQQIEPNLRPVLRKQDLDNFDLDDAFAMVSAVAAKV